ncbi:MAG TPA: hypothetical protein VEU33_08425 [Archangium sp.]|nr:hypothetical protein [Archangium sp.]
MAVLVPFEQHAVCEQPEFLIKRHVASVLAINAPEREVVAWGQQPAETFTLIGDCLRDMCGLWPCLAIENTRIGDSIREELKKRAGNSAAEPRARIEHASRRAEAGWRLCERSFVEPQPARRHVPEERNPGSSCLAFDFNGRHDNQLFARNNYRLGARPISGMPGHDHDELDFGVQTLKRVKDKPGGLGRRLLKTINEQRDTALGALTRDLAYDENRQIPDVPFTPQLKRAYDFWRHFARENAILGELAEERWRNRQMMILHRDPGELSRHPQQRLFGRQHPHVFKAVERDEASDAAVLERLGRERQFRALSDANGAYHE